MNTRDYQRNGLKKGHQERRIQAAGENCREREKHTIHDQMRTVREREVRLACSSSGSDAEFGFSDATSDADTSLKGQEEDVELPLFEEESAGGESIIQVDRESPKLSLPDLDVNITGIEGLTLQE